MSLKNCVFGPQKSDGWDADSAGDWGTEENWESLDGDQGQRLFFFFFSPGYTLKHILNSDSVLCFESPNNHTFFCALRFK